MCNKFVYCESSLELLKLHKVFSKDFFCRVPSFSEERNFDLLSLNSLHGLVEDLRRPHNRLLIYAPKLSASFNQLKALQQIFVIHRINISQRRPKAFSHFVCLC